MKMRLGALVRGRLERTDQPALRGEQRRRGPARHTDLRVDVLNVVSHGLRRDGEPVSDLPVGVAARERAEHLNLSGGEPVRPGAPRRGPLTGRPEHRGDRIPVETAGPDIGRQLACCLVWRERARYGRGSDIAW